MVSVNSRNTLVLLMFAICFFFSCYNCSEMLELYVTETEKNTGKIVFSAGLAGTMQALGYTANLTKHHLPESLI